MNPLLVITAPDGSSLVLGEEPADARQPHRLMFEHAGHGAPEPVRGALPGFWITLGGRRHIVFAGDTLDEPDVDRVLLESPQGAQTCLARRTKQRSVWMSAPETFGDGAEIEPGAIVTATWLAGRRVVATRHTAPLQWGLPVPPRDEGPPPVFPDVESPETAPDAWTGYAPRA